MPRLARVVGIGLPHHITQRGNYRQSVFNSDDDRSRYLRWVAEYSGKHGLAVLAYCLMGNHVHFIAVPALEDSLARVFNSAHMRYSQYFNWKHKVSGHLWQARFFSCVLDSGRLLAAARYVERNPVRAGLGFPARMAVVKRRRALQGGEGKLWFCPGQFMGVYGDEPSGLDGLFDGSG